MMPPIIVAVDEPSDGLVWTGTTEPPQDSYRQGDYTGNTPLCRDCYECCPLQCYQRDIRTATFCVIVCYPVGVRPKFSGTGRHRLRCLPPFVLEDRCGAHSRRTDQRRDQAYPGPPRAHPDRSRRATGRGVPQCVGETRSGGPLGTRRPRTEPVLAAMARGGPRGTAGSAGLGGPPGACGTPTRDRRFFPGAGEIPGCLKLTPFR